MAEWWEADSGVEIQYLRHMIDSMQRKLGAIQSGYWGWEGYTQNQREIAAEDTRHKLDELKAELDKAESKREDEDCNAQRAVSE